MKRDMAKKDKLYSFMDNLTEEYEEAKVRMNVVRTPPLFCKLLGGVYLLDYKLRMESIFLR